MLGTDGCDESTPRLRWLCACLGNREPISRAKDGPADSMRTRSRVAFPEKAGQAGYPLRLRTASLFTDVFNSPRHMVGRRQCRSATVVVACRRTCSKAINCQTFGTGKMSIAPILHRGRMPFLPTFRVTLPASFGFTSAGDGRFAPAHEICRLCGLDSRMSGYQPGSEPGARENASRQAVRLSETRPTTGMGGLRRRANADGIQPHRHVSLEYLPADRGERQDRGGDQMRRTARAPQARLFAD